MQGNQQKEKHLDPRPIGSVMSDSTLSQILKKARQLQEIDRLLKSYLPEDACDHCQVMNYQDQTLTVSTTSGAWATALRFQERHLTCQLVQHPGLKGLRQIHFKVRCT